MQAVSSFKQLTSCELQVEINETPARSELNTLNPLECLDAIFGLTTSQLHARLKKVRLRPI